MIKSGEGPCSLKMGMNSRNKNLRGSSRAGAGSSPLSAEHPGRLVYFLPKCRKPSVSQTMDARPVCAWACVGELLSPFLRVNIKITVLWPHPSILLLEPNRSSKVNTDREAMTLWGASRQAPQSCLLTLTLGELYSLLLGL